MNIIIWKWDKNVFADLLRENCIKWMALVYLFVCLLLDLNLLKQKDGEGSKQVFRHSVCFKLGQACCH